MTCVIRSRSFAAALGIAALSSAAAPVRSLPAQSVPSPSNTPGTLAPYRAPLIALVQPAPLLAGASGAGSVPQDKPVVVFRFAAAEADDPLDVRSLVVAVDGADRTVLFQTTAQQAWGPLASDEQRARGELAAGPHRVVARICSTRGVCASADARVLVVPGVVSVAADEAALAKRGFTRVLGAVVSATRKLLLP